MPVKVRYYLLCFLGAVLVSLYFWDTICGLFFLFGCAVIEYIATKGNTWPTN